MKVLEKNPAKRYQSAGEMLAAIEAFEKLEQKTHEATVLTAPPPPETPKKRTGVRLVVAALVVLSLAGYFFLPGLIRSPASSGERSENGEVVVPPPEQQQGQGDEQTGTDERAAEEQGEALPDAAGSTTQQTPEIQPEEDTGTEAVATTGSLTVQSDPPGARIFLDNTPRGTTPRPLAEVSVGPHTVVLRLDGYEDYTAPVTVVEQQPRTVNATLIPLGTLQINVSPSGQLSIDVSPMGQLSIDGVARDQGSGETSIDVPAGRYTVTVDHEDFERWQDEVDVAPGQSLTLNIDFTKFVEVRVTSEDTSGVFMRGEIFVDGSPEGKTPRKIDVRVGLRSIEVRAEGYVQVDTVSMINFRQDWTDPLIITLRKIED